MTESLWKIEFLATLGTKESPINISMYWSNISEKLFTALLLVTSSHLKNLSSGYSGPC